MSIARAENRYRIMFAVGAIWNLLGGVAVIVLTEWIFRRSGLSVPQPPVYYQSWIALFMTFGLGYAMVAWRPRQNLNIVRLGIIGKLAFIVIYIGNRLAFGGDVPLLFAIPAAGDLVFVVFYSAYLRFVRINPVREAPPT